MIGLLETRKIGWLAGIAGAGAGVATVLWKTEVISTPLALLIALVPATMFANIIRTMRSVEVKERFTGALWRYYRDFWIATSLYMIGMGVAIAVWNRVEVEPPYAFALALLPTLPTWAMIYVMGRYIVEETDEYLRHRAVMSAMIGLGLVLVSGSFWGFLEMFDAAPNIWAWWTVPAWAIGMGAGQSWLSWRDRRHDVAEDDDDNDKDGGMAA
ncbi:MAG: hypothetical protein AAFY19_04540 [Pseudomonadota bacterium]